MTNNASYRLLLVEDNPGDADLAVERLSDVPGYVFELKCVTRLDAALMALAQQSFDAVILDLSLPDSNGIETLRRLRMINPLVTCIILSGTYSESLHQVALQEGAQDYISKNDSAARLLVRSILYALARTQAQREQQQMQKLVSVTPDAVLVVDIEGVVQFVNEAALKLFNRTREDFIGELIGFSVYEGDITEITVLRGKERRIAEMHVVHMEWSGRPAVLASIRDITEKRKLAEQLQQAQKMEAIGRLAGGIAHDFNNLLMAISGNVELARADLPINHPVQENMLAIQQVSGRAASIVRQILTFSRQREPERQLISLGAVIEDAISFLRATLPAHIEIMFRDEPDLPMIMADATQVYQIMMNLGANAAHAMRDHGGQIDVDVNLVQVTPEAAALTPDLVAGRYVLVSIRDTGHGMSPEIVNHIFDPFFTTKAFGEGTGLGLSVVHGIVKTHDGAVTVYSEPNKGTVFHLYFPVAVKAKTADETPRVEAQYRGERILYVDDDSGLVALASNLLQRRGYTVFGFDDPELALNTFLVNPHAFALAIIDRAMPFINGEKLARQMLAVRPDLPILLITGFARPDDRLRMREIGVRDILIKPDALHTLDKYIRETLHPQSAEKRNS